MGLRFRKSHIAVLLLLGLGLTNCSPQFSLIVANVTSWLFVDGDNSSGVSFNSGTNQNVNSPTMTTFNGQLFLVYGEGPDGIRTATYNNYQNNNGQMSGSWNFIGSAYSNQATKCGGASGTTNVPTLTVYNSDIFAAWQEQNNVPGGSNQNVLQIHAARFQGQGANPNWFDINGTTSCSGASGCPAMDCMNVNPANMGGYPVLSSFNSSLNLIWTEGAITPSLQWAVYNGGSWTYNPGAPLLTYDTSQNSSNPAVIVFNSKMYVAWEETDNLGVIHVSSYDGNIWRRVDGGVAALSQLSTAGNFAGQPSLAVFNNKLYAAWNEGAGTVNPPRYIRLAVYNGDDTNPGWKNLFPNGMAFNVGDATSANLVSFYGKLYLTWVEAPAPYSTHSVRVVVYNGNDNSPSIQFVDGAGPTGLNFSSGFDALSPFFQIFNGSLFLSWEENNSGAVGRVVVGH